MSDAALPTVGRIVHYQMSVADVGNAITAPGYDSSRCNQPVAGQAYAAVVVATFGGTACNLRVLLDGQVEFWATSRTPGDDPGHWSWPPRV